MKHSRLSVCLLLLAGAICVNRSGRSQRNCLCPPAHSGAPVCCAAAEDPAVHPDMRSDGAELNATVMSPQPDARRAEAAGQILPPAFAAFDEWTVRWQDGDESSRGSLLAEGIELARERRRRMADLMVSDPENALRLAVPYAVRKSLPGEVAEMLEQRVNARGDFNVAGVLPVPGNEDRVPSSVRWAQIGQETYHVATFGDGLDFVTKRRVPLNGIALPADAATNAPDNPVVRPDKVMALDPNPARELEPLEIAEILARDQPVCPTSGEAVTVNDSPGIVELAGDLHSFCGPEHMRVWTAEAVGTLGLTTPDPDWPVAASGGNGGVAASELPVAASAGTEGYKRFLFLRPRFSDSGSALADTISDSRATALMNEMISHFNTMSWGKLKIAPLGPSGSQFTSALALGKPAADYNDAGLSRLYPDARTAAQAAGYNLGDYQFFAVFTGGRPAAGYAGLAYVGGIGIHIANGYYGQSVLTHELGHNLGLPHAHRWDTGDNSIIGDGTNEEYGNSYDPMGSGNDSMHYVASHKFFLDWIPDAEAPRIGTAGIYRLHVCDDFRGANGLRGLRVSRNSSNDYWFDFRQTTGGTEFANGLHLHFSNRDGRQNYRTDALPKQSGVSLPVGMTFTDRTAGVHVTPLRVVPNTSPKAMDVAVGFNAAGNRPPSARIVAHSPHAAGGADCTWTVQASDPDGDTLAYYWDFGDGSHSWDGLPVQTHAFPADGEYAVHCVVSDTRGGVWRKSFIQTVGTVPAGQIRISGRVVDVDSKPLAGMRVFTDGNLDSWSASDGSYALCRVPTGVHAVSAMDVLENKLVFARTFSSSTNWTANATGADISVTDTSSEIVTNLVPRLSTWKYDDTGVDRGTAWRAAAYDDTAWTQGPGLLGYGNGGEGTVLSFGGNAQNKRNTYYFRKKFTVASPAVFKELRLLCKRDDAVMVYLNGTKIYQDNFAAAVTEANITYATAAADSTEPDSYQQQNGISKALLVPGENILTAEVHQVEPTSSDLAFDAELLGIEDAPTPGAQAAYLSSPEGGALIPSGTASITLTAEARARTANVTKVEFFADGAKLGEDTVAPYAFSWANPAPGAHTLYVVAAFSIGDPLTSGIVNVTVGTPPATLVTAGSVWKYRASTTAPASNWTEPAFNDSAWPEGTAQLGYGDGDEATNVSPGGTRYPQTQFRRTFSVNDPAAVTNLLCRLIRDDAAVVYLNGTLAFRHNFAFENNAWVPQAAGAANIENLWQQSPVDPALLRPGLNTLAVEIHQESATSSDMSFDFALEADVAAGRNRAVFVAAPSSVALPDPVVLTAEAIPGANLSVTKVEFYASGVKAGEDTSWPFSLSWLPQAPGAYSITAVATDSAGVNFTGSSASVIVRNAPQGTVLVKWGETWKYSDAGVDPGANWPGRTSFDDTDWTEGSARFGYGGDGESTSLFVRDAAAKPPAVYFRKKFTVANPAAFDSLRLRVIRDDGVSVQINRTEVLRNNLPEGTLGFSTLATVNAEDEQAPVEIVIPTSSLRAGENQLAVEVHQNTIGSSDLSFDLELTGLKSPPAATSLWLTSPASGAAVHSDDPLVCRVGFFPAVLGLQRVEYFAGSAKFGEAVAAPWTFTWSNPLKGSYSVSARAHLTNGQVLTSPAAVVTVGSPVLTQDLIWSGADWKYLDTGVVPAVAWTSSTFDDAGWKTGRSRLGFGGDGEITYVTPGQTIYWFRRSFTVPSGIPFTAVNLRVIRDDGIQLYLNGNRIWKDNLPADPVAANALATSSLSGADEQIWNTVTIPVSALQAGNNVFAAEIRQSSATSSDLSFDLSLSVDWLTPGGLTNSAPASAPAAAFTATAGGTYVFTIPEIPGRIYRLESSADLNSWSAESTHILTGNFLSIPLPAAGPSRYYRARWLSSP